MKTVNKSFTYAEYAVSKFLAGKGGWLVHHDYGVDNIDRYYVSGYSFLKIGKRHITKTPKKDVEQATNYSAKRFELEMEQLSSKHEKQSLDI